jgi:hypothetical protein
MSWKNILKAPYDYTQRSKAEKDRNNAKRQVREAEDRIKANEPKEDISTDVSRFVSEYLDKQFVKYDSATVEKILTLEREQRRILGYKQKPEETKEWGILTELLNKYSKDELEEKIGKLYNTKAFITNRSAGSEEENYVIDLGVNQETRKPNHWNFKR